MRLRRRRLQPPSWSPPEPQLTRLPLLDAALELVTILRDHPYTPPGQRVELAEWERALRSWWRAEVTNEEEKPYG